MRKTLKIKVSLDPTVIKVDKADYQDAWQEHCEEEGDLEEGEDAGEPSDEFVLEQLQEEYDDGQRDVADDFSGSAISLEIEE